MSLPVHETRRLAALGGDTEALISRRLAGEPLQYIEGSAAFGPIELLVDDRVLVPRPETEQLWDEAVRAVDGRVGPGSVLVDLCTGAGGIALALKHRFPTARVIGTDVDPDALVLARANGQRLDLDVEWREGDLFGALPLELRGRIDLITTNPPYVSEYEWEALPEDVKREPRQALVAGPRGTEVVDRIANEAYWWLGVGGWVFCEIGETQGQNARSEFGRWMDTDLRTDLAGRDRILIARKGASCC